MIKLFGSIALLLFASMGYSQGQFKNYGNFQAFPGSTISFFGDVINEGTFTDNSQTISFSGPAGQAISGSVMITFKNFVANNTTGVTLQQNIVANALALTEGPLNLNGKTLTINNPASSAVSRTNGYVVSENVSNANKITWSIGTDVTAHVFPFGTAAGDYIPLTLTNASGNIGNVTVSTYPTGANNLPYPTTPDAVTNIDAAIGNNSVNVVDRFWQIDKDGAGGTATITFVATAAEVGTITTLRAQRWNSALQEWDPPLPGQTSGATSVTVPNVTTFSPWAISGNNAPLPVELLSFTATPVETKVNLDWKTASEYNNDYFTVQRSSDGKEFRDIAKVPAGNAGTTVQKYNYVDIHAFRGRSYYRLKQTDLDGQHKFSDIRTVTLGDHAALDITVFPNPVTDNEFSMDFQQSLESSTVITVYNVTGAVIYSTMVEPGVRKFNVRLNYPPKGVYIVRAVSREFNFQQSIVVK
jgi:hypothetical protein